MKYMQPGTSSVEEKESERKTQQTKKIVDYPEVNMNKQIERVDSSAMPSELKLEVFENNLDNCLQIIDDEVMKGYVTKLSNLELIDPQEKLQYNLLENTQFFKITELVYEQDEFSVHKLAAVFQTLYSKPCTLILMIQSNAGDNDFYLGVRPRDNRNSPGTMRDMLQKSLIGQFPGTKTEVYHNDEQLIPFIEKLYKSVRSVSAVTSVADFKQHDMTISNKDFIQGLEKFIYSIKGKNITSIFIADNIEYSTLNDVKREYESIYTQISPFSEMQFGFTDTNTTISSKTKSKGNTVTQSSGENQSVTENDSTQYSESRGTNKSNTTTDTKGQSISESNGETDTVGETDSSFESKTKSKSVNGNIGVDFGGQIGGGVSGSSASTKGESHADTVSHAISKTLTSGISTSSSNSETTGESNSVTEGNTKTKGTQTGTSYSVSESFNLVDSDMFSDSFGNSKSITLNSKNRTIHTILEKIDKQLDRLDECESIGMWNFAAYFLGEVSADTETAANTYYSLVAGSQSGIERSSVNTWTDDENYTKDDNPVAWIKKYILNFVHPCFIYNGLGNREVIVNPTSMVSTNELAIHMALPRHSVKGLPVIEHATFAQEVLTVNDFSKSHAGNINLGNIYHLGEETNEHVALNTNSLAMHTFVTGSTGSGKSNTVYTLLKECKDKKIPFLVIEPAKGEYRNVFPDVCYFSTNGKKGEILHINPFSFPDDIHVLEHIDRLIEIFNVCWPMYAAMPAVLKDSIEKAYISTGWDLVSSENKYANGLFPSFDDVLRELNTVIKLSAYSEETKSNYIGSLSTRLNSLTNGINGVIFTSNEIEGPDLFDRSAIVDISRVGSMETKSLIMGIMVLKLQEYRMSNSQKMNCELRHITVLEEAHNLLKKTSYEQSMESANVQGKSVEMLTNAIAEIRTYGEGFIIVDQAPNLLDTAVIRNTNTKIVHRLPEGDDREHTGKSMSLNDKQIDELSKLPTGVAAVYQNDWQEAVLCKVNLFTISDNLDVDSKCEMMINDNKILHLLLKNELSDEEIDEAKQLIVKLNASARIRRDLIANIQNQNNSYNWALADYLEKNYNISENFRRTHDNKFSTLSEFAEEVRNGIRVDFTQFSELELSKIMLCACYIQHELTPHNKSVELLYSALINKLG